MNVDDGWWNGMSTDEKLSNEELSRYSRHLLLDQVGIAGQTTLKNSSVLCVGTGGLGSPVLMYLAAAGVGKIGIIDFDMVDESNLQRQIIHGTSTLGIPKVQSAKARLLDINPYIEIVIFEEALTSENAIEVVQQFDVVVDGTDNFPTRYLVNDACVLCDKPNVYGSIFKFEGQASVFNHMGGWIRPSGWDACSKKERQALRIQKKDWVYSKTEKGPNYRDLYPEPPPPGMVPSCAQGGVLGVLPGVIGCIQANECIKVLLGLGQTLSGRILTYDALHMQFREFKLQRNPNADPITKLVDYQLFCGFDSHVSLEESFVCISVHDVQRQHGEGWNPFVLDVRSAAEEKIVSLNFVDLRHSHSGIAKVLSSIPLDRDILVYCKTGGRSAQACSILAEHGYTRLFSMDGGIIRWIEEIDSSLVIY